MVNVKVIVLGLLSVFLIAVFLSTPAQAASLNKKRASSNICTPGVRCGWYVYNKTTRILEHPHKACDCPDNESCIKAADDVSISAYEYRCVNITGSSQEWPKDATSN